MKEMKKTGKFTDKEWEELASLLSDEKRENTGLLQRFQDEDVMSTGKEWRELRNIGGEEKTDVDSAWNNLNTKLRVNGFGTEKRPVRFSLTTSRTLRIAASVLIILTFGTSLIYLNNRGVFSKKITYITNNDEKNLRVSLPDGSEIFLNRNSQLSYRANLGKLKREVKLTGEAFFEISPDKLKPFIIYTGNAMIRVVGTSFNVITNNPESAVEVYVKTGKVMLSDNSGSKSILLDPGFIGTLDSKLTGKTLNTNPNYLSWNTGLLIYNGQKLDVVFHDLKRVYNMDVVADDPAILDNPWTSPIDNKSEETIIQLICLSFNLKYTKVGTVYHLAKK